MKKEDFFSQQSKAYAAFRPTYPAELYQFIFEHLRERNCAWDCATGNGQVARHLASHFDTVFATDISAQQIKHAVQAENIIYSLAPAEKTNFSNYQFDLITVAQALHWLNAPVFFKEAMRTARPGALLAAWGYSLPTFQPAIDELLLDFYTNTVGPFWHATRKLVENHYRDIVFPFERIDCPEFQIRVNWTADQFAGYVTSWSATQNYVRALGLDPVEELKHALKSVWKPDEIKAGTFPLFVKLHRIG